MDTTVTVHRTKSRLTAAWECGGGYTNTGDAVIICDREGKSKKPIFVPRKGYANREHALFAILPGDCFVFANADRNDTRIAIARVVAKNPGVDGHVGKVSGKEKEIFFLEPVAERELGQWDNEEAAAQFADAVAAADKKVRCYHCREAHYLQRSEVDNG